MKILILILIIILSYTSYSQEHKSIHQMHSEEHQNSHPEHQTCHPELDSGSIDKTAVVWEVLKQVQNDRQKQSHSCGLNQVQNDTHIRGFVNKERSSNKKKSKPWKTANKIQSTTHKVFGYHAYWASSNYNDIYDWSVLSTIGVFSYEVDTATGTYNTLRDWDNRTIVEEAHANGVKAVLCVTNFGSKENTAILSNESRRKTLIDSLVAVVLRYGGDGVNIDFEIMPSSQRENLVLFMDSLATGMRRVIPDAEISMATPSVDWNNSWDFERLAEICDYFFIMGYGYYYGGSNYAGPSAPLYSGNYNLSKTVEKYISEGVPPNKILLGLPWYGYSWKVENSTKNSKTLESGNSFTYSKAKGYYDNYGYNYDNSSHSPWVSYKPNGDWNQLWCDDSASLAVKYDYAKEMNLGGVGIWAMHYSGTGRELWDGLKEKFLEVGIEDEISISEEIKIYPNPCGDVLFLEFTNARMIPGKMKIYNSYGKLVLQTDVDSGVNKINLEDLPSGMYFIQIANTASTNINKFLKID